MAFRARRRSGSVDWDIDTSRLNEILRNLPGNRRNAVRATAFSIEGKAKVRAPVDTGALRNSIYVRMGRTPSEMPVVAGDAPRAELPEPGDDDTAHVGPSVGYAIYQELGTHNMAANPFLGPAVAEAVDELAQNMGAAVTDGRN